MDSQNFRKEAEETLKAMRNSKEILEMEIKELAILYGVHFRVLKTEGFTDDQAFEIVKFRGLC